MKPLLHPITLAALVVLVLNDHLLKSCFPGVVTGKLSDVAGMILAPIVLSAIISAPALELATVEKLGKRRAAWACVIAVALVFSLTKTWAPATRAWEMAFETLRAPIRFVVTHVLARPAYSERVVLVRDPTDLIALPFGLIAAAILTSSPQRAAADEGAREARES